MKLGKFLNTSSGQVVTLAIVAGIGIYYAEKKSKQAAYALAPTNPDNVFAGGVDSIGATITGNEHFKLGGAIYDVTHTEDNQNVFSAGVDSVGASLTGDEHFKLGGWIYELFHGKSTP